MSFAERTGGSVVPAFRSALPIRVMLVDDDERLRAALRGLLEEQGFAVVGEAGDPSTAIDLAKAGEPDVALVDFRLNGSNGVTLTESLKCEAPGMGVIMFTAFSEQSLAADAARAGASRFLVKGCSPALIIEAIRAVVPR